MKLAYSTTKTHFSWYKRVWYSILKTLYRYHVRGGGREGLLIYYFVMDSAFSVYICNFSLKLSLGNKRFNSFVLFGSKPVLPSLCLMKIKIFQMECSIEVKQGIFQHLIVIYIYMCQICCSFHKLQHKATLWCNDQYFQNDFSYCRKCS